MKVVIIGSAKEFYENGIKNLRTYYSDEEINEVIDQIPDVYELKKEITCDDFYINVKSDKYLAVIKSEVNNIRDFKFVSDATQFVKVMDIKEFREIFCNKE